MIGDCCVCGLLYLELFVINCIIEVVICIIQTKMKKNTAETTKIIIITIVILFIEGNMF